MIKELHERGLYRKDIANRLGVHPKTVTRALKQGDAPSRRGVRPPRCGAGLSVRRGRIYSGEGWSWCCASDVCGGLNKHTMATRIFAHNSAH